MSGVRSRCPRCPRCQAALTNEPVVDPTTGASVVRCGSCGAKVRIRSGPAGTAGGAPTATASGRDVASATRPAAAAAAVADASADDLLPPSAGDVTAASSSPPPARPIEAGGLDDLLPPTIDGRAAADPADEDGLLPPGVTRAGVVRKALPAESLPRDFLRPARSDRQIVIPTAEGEVRITPKKKTVVVAGQERELRELSREASGGRRTLTNLVVLAFCVVVLLVGLGLLTWLVRPVT